MDKLRKEIEGVFKPPKNTYYLGKIKFGTPYFYPRNHNKTIISFRHTPLKYSSNKSFKLFGLYWYLGWPIVVRRNTLGWKDKFETPRFEWSPAFYLFFFKWQLCVWKSPPFGEVDLYWEMILWWKEYSKKDIELAKSTWPWVSKGVSTWDDAYLIKSPQNK